MFHVMLILSALIPALATLAIVFCLPFWVGLGLQAILSAVTEKKPLLYLPAVLGAICAVGYFVWLGEIIPLWFLLAYWAVFFLCLWLTRFLIGKLRALVLRWVRGNG